MKHFSPFSLNVSSNSTDFLTLKLIFYVHFPLVFQTSNDSIVSEIQSRKLFLLLFFFSFFNLNMVLAIDSAWTLVVFLPSLSTFPEVSVKLNFNPVRNSFPKNLIEINFSSLGVVRPSSLFFKSIKFWKRTFLKSWDRMGS